MYRSTSVRRFLFAVTLPSMLAALVLLDDTQAQTAKGKKFNGPVES